jgi:CubicO group peptidase (beta-lactamase class C family)
VTGPLMTGARRVVALISALAASAGLAQAPAREARVEAVFAAVARPDAPGCAVGVAEDGRQVFARGYGAAALGDVRPIGPDTIFDIASVSKQFTAFAAVLLAERGRLSLDDDVRRHVPELPDLGARITLAHLIDHSSGLPDYLTVSNSVGRPFPEALDQARAFAIVRRLDRLDFTPGAGFGYSNSNYLLLTVAIERAVGATLGEFLDKEVFAPLGMRGTRLAPDDRVPIAGRAVGYVPGGAGAFRVGTGTGSDYGSRGVQSTVGDLLVWAHALETGRFGRDVYRRMTTPRRLASGERLRYGAALIVEPWRGRPVVRHGGTDPRGYTAELLRLPEDRTAIAVLCNRGGVFADQLAERAAAAWLGDRLPPEPAAPTPSPAIRAAAGRYVAEDGRAFELRLDGDRVLAPPLATAPLRVIDDRTLGYGSYLNDARLELSGEAGVLMVSAMGQPPLPYRRYDPPSLAASDLAAYAGTYFNAAYGGLVEIGVADGRLTITDLYGVARAMTSTLPDRFIIAGGTGFRFERGPDGRAARLVIAQGRVRRMVFDRVRR